MYFQEELSDDFPPIFNRFKDFFEAQRTNWFENSEKHRTEMFEQFTVVANENERLQKELVKTKKELLESKDILEETEKVENEEIEELEMQLRNATYLNEKFKKEIKENLAQRDDTINESVRAKVISDQVIQSLKGDVKKLEREMKESIKGKDMHEEVLKHEIQVDRLHLEIEKSKTVILNLKYEAAELLVDNDEKRTLILKMTEEGERMEEKLESLQIKNDNMNPDFKISKPNVNDANNLHEELKFSTGYDDFDNNFECASCGNTFATECIMEEHSKTCTKKTTHERTKYFSLKCESCGKTVVSKNKIEDHMRKCIQKKFWDQKVLEIEKEISEQTFQITKSIYDLKEEEFEERISCKRECKPGCKVFHTKHNWSKTHSNKYLENLEGIRKAFIETISTGTIPKSYSCKICGEICSRVCDLKTHKENSHSLNQDNTNELQESAVNRVRLEEEDDIFIIDNYSVNFKDSSSDGVQIVDRGIQNLCLICLLSFKTENDLKEHLQKHSTVKTLPSILKKI